MSQCYPISIPIAGGDMPTHDNDHSPELMDATVYRNAVGKWMYAMVGTRPDIAFAVSYASRYYANPTQHHKSMVDRIAKYIQGTKNFALEYKHDPNGINLYGYCDADWAGDKFDRHSTSGYLFFLCGAPISWSSHKQATVALSSTEAEYMSLTHASKEATWLRQLLKDLGQEQIKPTLLYEDNRGCIDLAKNPIHHSRTKHIDIQYHFIREKIQNNEITLQHCKSDDMLADICTKALARDKYVTLRNGMGLKPLPN
jgi:hypothetical protein